MSTTHTDFNNTLANDFSVSYALSGGGNFSEVKNTSNTFLSDAYVRIQVAGTSANDPYLVWTVNGSTAWAAGIDQSASRFWKLSQGSTLGANDVIAVDPGTNGNMTLTPKGTGSVVCGSGTAVTAAGSDAIPLQVVKANTGAAVYAVIKNTNNSNTSSHAQLNIYSGGSSGGDPSVNFDCSATTWNTGIYTSGNNTPFLLTNGGTSPSTGTIVLKAYPIGSVTIPLSPAFLAYQASTINNVTGNSTSYTLGVSGALTEVFDQQNNFTLGGSSAATFTAPTDARYYLSINARVTNVNNSTNVYRAIITTSNRTYSSDNDGPISGGIAINGLFLAAICDMDSSDTATFAVLVDGQGADTVGLGGNSSLRTFVCGRLVC